MDRVRLFWENKPNKGWRIGALLLVAIVLAARYNLWSAAEHANGQTAASHFNAIIQDDITKLSNRFEIYADSLYSGRALLLADSSVTRQNWTDFVDAQNIKQRYPGVYGVGYVSVINREQVASLTSRLNADRLSSDKGRFSIHPASTGSQLAILIYLAPEDTNQQAIGYDLLTNAQRAQTLRVARDSGTVRASVPLRLVTDKPSAQASLLLAMPVYGNSSLALKTVAERRASLKGYVLLALHSRPLLDSIFKSIPAADSSVAITAASNGQVLYSIDQSYTGKTLHKTVIVTVAGQPWRLSFSAPDSFGLTSSAKLAPNVVIWSTVPFILVLCAGLYCAMHLQLLRAHYEEHHAESEDKDNQHNN